METHNDSLSIKIEVSVKLHFFDKKKIQNVLMDPVSVILPEPRQNSRVDTTLIRNL